MDLWVIAAAAGAGYVAKYWQQFTSKEEGSTSSEPVSGDLVYGDSDSRKLFQKFRDQALPLPRLGKKDVWDGYNRSGYGDDETGIASTSGDVVNGNVLSLMNLSAGVCGSQNFQEIGYGDKKKNELAMGETGSIRISRSRNVENRSNGYLVKPMDSLESCLIAQLYKEQYVYSSVASPSVSNVRPLLVTNGRQIISRASSEVHRDSGLGEKEIRSRMGSIELPRRTKVSFAKQRRSSRFSISSTRVSEGAYPSQGSSNGMLLFFLGITIGIMSTVVTNQRELDKLNELLKKSESLVQDLQEELEMKEFSTMKELDSKDIEYPTIVENSNEQDQVRSENGTEKAELMNSIEAELEAELQKLELSMKTSRLERISKLAELDPDFETDKFDSNQDISGTSTTELHPPNYAVPPMELSLRLHELIQSRLEARIAELEAALENSEQRRLSMAYSESDQSLSTQESPAFRDEPMVMNLSGEALDAYNEAYEEMYRISDADPEIEMPRDLFLEKLRAVEEKTSRSLSSNGLRESEEEEEDDEMEKLLIKQIVERTKGSDAILSVLNSLKDQ